MKIFSTDEINSNKIVRALNDLQRGLPLTINKEYLIAPVETLYERNFNRLRAFFKDKLIIITPIPNHYITLDASSFSFKQIESFYEHSQQQNSLYLDIITKYEINPNKITKQLYLFVKELLTTAKLAPIFLLAKLNTKHTEFVDNNIFNINPQDFISYKKTINSTIIQTVTNVPVHLKHTGTALITIFRVMSTGEEHIVIASKNLAHNKTPLVRLHSSCFTGDLLQSLQCDCNSQLLAAIKLINEKPENAGIVIYLSQEGRGIGLANKLRAYSLQSKGYDTVEANLKLGFDMDERDYSIAAEILRQLKIKTVKLLTNNPQKSEALKNEGIAVAEVLPLITKTNNYNKKYMETKKHKMSHTI